MLAFPPLLNAAMYSSTLFKLMTFSDAFRSIKNMNKTKHNKDTQVNSDLKKKNLINYSASGYLLKVLKRL